MNPMQRALNMVITSLITGFGFAFIFPLVGAQLMMQQPIGRPIPAVQSTSQAPSLNVGDIAHVRFIGTNPGIATTPEALNDLQRAVRANDAAGYLRLFISGRAFRVDDGVSVRLIGMTALRRKVRILDGPLKDRAGWVPVEWLQ